MDQELFISGRDLVKSHLMIAVREEVEVLKEKISELMDKINQLEVENTILKANMGTTSSHCSCTTTGAPTSAIAAAAASAVVANAAVNANSNSSTAVGTPQSNVGSGTATPTTAQQPSAAAAADQNMEAATQLTNAANTDDSQGSVHHKMDQCLKLVKRNMFVYLSATKADS
ncbi:hypothetical protein EVAR_69515_1 [Eumeta japonica]|uniref:TSC22 domain family protein 1 n=1 Tax=Eumeta variegata TaxID=151549 RepID=A0A4C2ACR7_EUMVA|nr:hypothetical protein EVAR_69515_1 [Eumeta japonica]